MLSHLDPASTEPALERATRKSELLRIRVIIAIAVAMVLFIIGTSFVTSNWVGVLPPLFIGMTVLIYETLVLQFAKRADRENRSLPLPFWRINAAIECVIPSMGLLHLTTSGEVTPSQGLIAPPILGYVFFMTLQILSLRPSIVLIGAIVSAISYILIVTLMSHAYDLPPGMPLPIKILAFYPFSILMIGFGGAGVCMRIRSHVLAEISNAMHREAAESELGAASKIQRSLLPEEAPDISGFEIAGWNRPAVHTGGDYYDWQGLPDGKVAVLLADVSGHGLGPALVAAFCRAYTRASLSHAGTLADVVARVNTLVCSDLPEAWFITFVATILRPDSNELELISAGHGPILHVSAATGEATASGADGVPLGIDQSITFAEARKIQLEAGDLLVLVTDGFHEWEGPNGARYGVDRLQEQLARHVDLPPRDIIAEVLEDLESFAGDSPQEDDLTIVIIKRCA